MAPRTVLVGIAGLLALSCALSACAGGKATPPVVGSPDAGPADAGLPDGGACIGAALLTELGKSSLLVGASMADATASAGNWDVRYEYIAGGFNDSSGPCASCASGCISNGKSCANSAGGCAWWGCYQYDQLTPGFYIRDFVAKAAGRGEIPMLTYYELLQASKVNEGSAEVTKTADQPFMSRYFNDFRFFLQQIGTARAFVQVEPDFWGYAERVNSNPHLISSAVASANPTDCAAQENTFAGLGRCLIAMARKYSPSALIGFHGSGFATGPDCLSNTDTALDVAAEGRKLGAFLLNCGAAGADFITVDASDRDEGYYAFIGNPRTWDPANAKLPTFHQAFNWVTALSESTGLPVFFWQVPVGNSSQNNTANHWQDNRVDYFFSHSGELAAAHVAGMFFGAGAGDQTTPESDGGNLLAKLKAYRTAGGQAVCR